MRNYIFAAALVSGIIMWGGAAFAQTGSPILVPVPSNVASVPQQQAQAVPTVPAAAPQATCNCPCANANNAASAAVAPVKAQAPADPCAAYQTQDGYAMCQDRIKKLQRVQSYQQSQTAPAPAAEPAPAAAPEASGTESGKKAKKTGK